MIGSSLKLLTKMLEKHHGKKVFLLIDEYDTPLQTAYLKEFFRDAIVPLREMFGDVLKGNEHIYKAVVTGITRISKESMFSGLNNFQTYGLKTNKFVQYFGLTEDEVRSICPKDHLDDLKSWYNGYVFGHNLTIYNPWSIINFLDQGFELKPYWINTSGNDLIKSCLTLEKMENTKKLLNNEAISIEYDPFIIFDELKTNKVAFWNLLFTAGYLTSAGQDLMRIPNKEIYSFFEKIIIRWFGIVGEENILILFLHNLVLGNLELVQFYLQKMVEDSFGIKDMIPPARESFYHGFVLGLVLGLKDRYKVDSNRESGMGYYDIALYPN